MVFRYSTVGSSLYKYKKPVVITGSVDGALSAFQCLYVVNFEAGHMNADFSDIRFFDTDGVTALPYKIISYVASTTANVWVKVPNIAASPTETTIWMYYGNAGLSDGSNGDDTFEFFDDFLGSSLDGAKWTTLAGTPVVADSKVTIYDASVSEGIRSSYQSWGVNYIVEYYGIRDSYTIINTVGFYSVAASDNRAMFYSNYGNNNQYGVQSDNTVAGDGTITALGTGYTGWHTWEVHRAAGTSNVYKIDGSTVATHTTHVNSANMGIKIEGLNGQTTICDWVFIRKYIANEPTYSIGAENSVSSGSSITSLQYIHRLHRL